MGEMSVASEGELLRALLGSCVGLALYDRQQKIGGLAHIVLPEARGKTDQPGKFADTAIPELIQQMSELAGQPLRLSAKLVGGASMFSHSAAASIGDQNVEACRQQLNQLRVPVVAQHCGGKQGRKISLDTASGLVRIEIVGQDSIEL